MEPLDLWDGISLQTTILLAEFKHLTPASYSNLSSIIIHQQCSGLGFVQDSQVLHRDVVISEQKHKILHNWTCGLIQAYSVLQYPFRFGICHLSEANYDKAEPRFKQICQRPLQKTPELFQIMCSLMEQ